MEPQLPSAFFLWRRKTGELTPLKVGAGRKSLLFRSRFNAPGAQGEQQPVL